MTVVVFYYLAVPVLRDLIGPAVVLPAFVAVAVLAGLVTYHAVRYRSGREADVDVPPARAGGAASSERPEPAGRHEAGRGDGLTVNDMIEELETSREK